MMKALTLWPEWAWAVANLNKTVENRTYRPPRNIVGKRIAIHAGKKVGGRYVPTSKMATPYYEIMMNSASNAGWYPEVVDEAIIFKRRPKIFGGYEKLIPEYLTVGAIVATARIGGVSYLSPGRFEVWSAEGQYQWHLDDLVVLDDPVLCMGRQAVWCIPEDVERKVLEQCSVIQ